MMATTTIPEPVRAVTMPADTQLAHLHRMVQTYSTQIIAGCTDAESGYLRADRVMDVLPTAITAVQENPLSVDAAEQLHSLATQLHNMAEKLSAVTGTIRRTREIGANAMAHYEKRLEVVRHDGAETLGDSWTASTVDEEHIA